jgi:hypothetical protein
VLALDVVDHQLVAGLRTDAHVARELRETVRLRAHGIKATRLIELEQPVGHRAQP